MTRSFVACHTVSYFIFQVDKSFKGIMYLEFCCQRERRRRKGTEFTLYVRFEFFDSGGYESEFSPIEMCSCLVNSIGVTWGGVSRGQKPHKFFFLPKNFLGREGGY